MIDRIVRFEDGDGVVIAVDESGRKFSSPAGKWDWQPVDLWPPDPIEPEPKSAPRPAQATRRRFMRR